jgi:hypothetical protein
VVEGAPLLREYTRKGIEGSNPFLSAIFIRTLPPSTEGTMASDFVLSSVRPFGYILQTTILSRRTEIPHLLLCPPSIL